MSELRRFESGGKIQEELVFTKEVVDDFFIMLQFWPLQPQKNTHNLKHISKVIGSPLH